MNHKKLRLALFFVVILATFLTYAPTIGYDFAWDDQRFILEWQTPKLGLKAIPLLFLGDAPIGHEYIYRPMRGVYYIITNIIFGTNPRLYHLNGILIHLCATAFVFGIGLELSGYYLVGLIAAIVFGLHPVHLESVAWITSSFDTLGQTITLAAYFTFLKSKQMSRRGWYYLSIILTTVAVFSHETASTLIILIFGTLIIIHRYNLKKIWTQRNLLLPYISVTLVYWIVRFSLLHIISRQPYPFGSPWEAWYYMGSVIIKYLQMLIVPLKLTVNPNLSQGIQSLFWADINHFHPPPPPSLINPQLILSWVIIILLCFLIIITARRARLFSFTLFWIGISLVPFMQFFPTSALYSDRYLYPASVGWALLVGWGIALIIRSKRLRRYQKPAAIFIATLILFYGVRTLLREPDWRNNLALWTQAVHANPASNSNYTNLGNAYYNQGDISAALEAYQHALDLNPSQALNYTNIGIIAQDTGDLSRAGKLFNQAATMNPPDPMALLYAGIIAHQSQDYQTAQADYLKFKAEYPRFPDTYLYLGMLNHQLGHNQEALTYYQQAIALEPGYADAYNNLGNLYRDLGEAKQAIQAYDTALKIDPHHPYAAKNLTDVLQSAD